ncbi:MAG: type IV toxin-antitoxin system AbiEi family antitoxin [Planctomycetota bacterium]
MVARDPPASAPLESLARYFDRQGGRVYTRRDVMRTLAGARQELALRSAATHLLDSLIESNLLVSVLLKSEADYPQLRRYVWRSASSFEVAVSLRKDSYVSHSTAVFLHGLTDHVPQTQYVNAEQSPKPAPTGEMTQASLDRAFRTSQRISRLAYIHGTTRIVIISGKSTDRLGVVPLPVAEGRSVDATSLERTLVDLVVRPAYGGGVHQVLSVFRAARERVSVPKIIAVLDDLNYAYPYHQALGFYLERAGAAAAELRPLRRRPKRLKFYLAHGLKEPAFDDSWQIYIPKRL